MATRDDVRRISLSLPEAYEVGDGRFAFAVPNKGKGKEFVWVWMERVDEKKPRVPNPDVIGVRVGGLEEKEMILASDSEKYFTEPHYNRYPAVLVRLAATDAEELEELIVDGWRCQAPKSLVKEYDG